MRHLLTLLTIICTATPALSGELWQVCESLPAQATFSGNFAHTADVYYAGMTKSTLLLDFDWDTPAMAYTGFSLDLPYASTHSHQAWTTGPGQEKRIDMIMEFDPLYIEGIDSHTVALTPQDSGMYGIGGPGYQLNTSLTLTGTYEVTGPTESIAGAFSVFLPNSSSVSYFRMRTRDYPDNLWLYGEAGFQWSGSTDPIFDTIIDGEPVSAGISSFGVVVRYPHAYLRTVPEPSAFALVAMSAIGLMLWFRFR